MIDDMKEIARSRTFFSLDVIISFYLFSTYSWSTEAYEKKGRKKRA